MDIPAPAYAAVGAITAAIIAGGISFIVSVLAKDQKTSEFRQAWIDGLRDDISDFISLFFLVSDMSREVIRKGIGGEGMDALLMEKDEHFRRLEMLDARIQLRANPKEHTELLKAVSALREYPGSAQILDSKAAEAMVEKLVTESQLVLKREWIRVKRGEPVFFATKWISLLILLGALSIGVAFARSHLRIEFLS